MYLLLPRRSQLSNINTRRTEIGYVLFSSTYSFRVFNRWTIQKINSKKEGTKHKAQCVALKELFFFLSFFNGGPGHPLQNHQRIFLSLDSARFSFSTYTRNHYLHTHTHTKPSLFFHLSSPLKKEMFGSKSRCSRNGRPEPGHTH